MPERLPDDIALGVQLEVEQDPIACLRVAEALVAGAAADTRRVKGQRRQAVENAHAALRYALHHHLDE